MLYALHIPVLPKGSSIQPGFIRAVATEGESPENTAHLILYCGELRAVYFTDDFCAKMGINRNSVQLFGLDTEDLSQELGKFISVDPAALGMDSFPKNSKKVVDIEIYYIPT